MIDCSETVGRMSIDRMTTCEKLPTPSKRFGALMWKAAARNPPLESVQGPSHSIFFTGIFSIGMLPLNLRILALPGDSLTVVVILHVLLGVANRPLLTGRGSPSPRRTSALNLPVAVSSGKKSPVGKTS